MEVRPEALTCSSGVESGKSRFPTHAGPATVPPMPKGKSKDVLGCVYEYLLGKFASAEGTLQSAKTSCSNRRMKRDFSLSASIGDLRSLGSDERNSLLVKARCGPNERARVSHWAGVRCRISRNADSFRADLHPDLKADFVPVRKDLATPPFNMSDWGGEYLRQDMRWKFGMPPVNNALLFGGESELSLIA